MYLTERIISLLIFMSVTIFTYLVLLKTKLKSQKYVLVFYIAILAFLAYSYKPLVTADLYRIQESLSTYYYNMNFDKLVKVLQNSLTPVASLYYFIFSKFNNVQLLPAFTSIVFYGNIFYILYEYAKEKNLKNTVVANTFLFFMFTGQFLEVISGIRCLMGFSLIANCIFREYFKNKSLFKNIVIYVIASLLHPACLVLTAIRFMIYIFKENKRNFVFILFSIGITGAMIYYGLPYISHAFEYGKSYLNSNVYSYIWEYLIGIIILIFMLVNYLFYKSHNEDNKNYSGLLCILIIGLFIFSFEYSIFHRFTIFLTMIGLPMIESNLAYMKKDIKVYGKYNFLFCLTVLAIGFIVFTRGNLCGYKMF